MLLIYRNARKILPSKEGGSFSFEKMNKINRQKTNYRKKIKKLKYLQYFYKKHTGNLK